MPAAPPAAGSRWWWRADASPPDGDAIEWLRRGEDLGAGEILLTSMDRDGTADGYDLEQLREATEAVSVPVIASGGAGNPSHLAEVFEATRRERGARRVHLPSRHSSGCRGEAFPRPARDPGPAARGRFLQRSRTRGRAMKPKLRWNAAGLVPAVVQDAVSGRILMLAWMNEEALARTIESGRVHFWSRSRRTLWKKGETSGNELHLRSLTADCDGDAILVQADPTGPACHTGRTSCFFEPVTEGDATSEPAPAAELAPALAALTRIVPGTGSEPSRGLLHRGPPAGGHTRGLCRKWGRRPSRCRSPPSPGQPATS